MKPEPKPPMMEEHDVVLETPNAVIRDVYYKYYADYLRLEKTEKRDE